MFMQSVAHKEEKVQSDLDSLTLVKKKKHQ